MENPSTNLSQFKFRSIAGHLKIYIILCYLFVNWIIISWEFVLSGETAIRMKHPETWFLVVQYWLLYLEYEIGSVFAQYHKLEYRITMVNLGHLIKKLFNSSFKFSFMYCSCQNNGIFQDLQIFYLSWENKMFDGHDEKGCIDNWSNRPPKIWSGFRKYHKEYLCTGNDNENISYR